MTTAKEYPWLKPVYREINPSEMKGTNAEKGDRLRRAVRDRWDKHGIKIDEVMDGILSVIDWEDAIRYLELIKR